VPHWPLAPRPCLIRRLGYGWLPTGSNWPKTPSRGGDVGWAKSTATSVGASFFQNLILKGYAIVFLEPGFRGVRGGEDPDVLWIADLLAGVDVDKSVMARPNTLSPSARGVTSGSACRHLNEKRPQYSLEVAGPPFQCAKSGAIDRRSHQTRLATCRSHAHAGDEGPNNRN
jgi:hypothetical protein